MRSQVAALLVLLFFAGASHAQTRPKPRPTPVIPSTVPVKETIRTGRVDGRTYTDPVFGFELTFPATWFIPGDDFEDKMKKQGFDLSLRAPDSLPISTRAQVNQAVKNVDVLLTVYRSVPGSVGNAIVRISVEDLSAHPQIKDAVDYFDAIRSTYAAMKLPVDVKYSETQAEKLGAMQFGYLDVSNKAGKKRMYATVRHGHAIQFTLSYTGDEDLETFRKVLAAGNFRLKIPAN